MENAGRAVFLLIYLWMSFGDSFHRWIMLGKPKQPHIQSEARLSPYIWVGSGFVHSIHTPYYYY